MSNLYKLRDGVYAKDEDTANEIDFRTTSALMAVLWVFERLTTGFGDVVYTDVLRDDPASTHYSGRAADVRIFHPDRGIGYLEVGAGPSEDDLDAIVLPELRAMFGRWEGNDGELHDVAVVHGEGLNRHIHIQVPDRSWR